MAERYRSLVSNSASNASISPMTSSLPSAHTVTAMQGADSNDLKIRTSTQEAKGAFNVQANFKRGLVAPAHVLSATELNYEVERTVPANIRRPVTHDHNCFQNARDRVYKIPQADVHMNISIPIPMPMSMSMPMQMQTQMQAQTQKQIATESQTQPEISEKGLVSHSVTHAVNRKVQNKQREDLVVGLVQSCQTTRTQVDVLEASNGPGKGQDRAELPVKGQRRGFSQAGSYRSTSPNAQAILTEGNSPRPLPKAQKRKRWYEQRHIGLHSKYYMNNYVLRPKHIKGKLVGKFTISDLLATERDRPCELEKPFSPISDRIHYLRKSQKPNTQSQDTIQGMRFALSHTDSKETQGLDELKAEDIQSDARRWNKKHNKKMLEILRHTTKALDRLFTTSREESSSARPSTHAYKPLCGTRVAPRIYGLLGPKLNSQTNVMS